jgi:hypothetical protein
MDTSTIVRIAAAVLCAVVVGVIFARRKAGQNS